MALFLAHGVKCGSTKACVLYLVIAAVAGLSGISGIIFVTTLGISSLQEASLLTDDAPPAWFVTIFIFITPLIYPLVGFMIAYAAVGVGVARWFVFASGRPALRERLLARRERERGRRAYAKHLRRRFDSFSDRRAALHVRFWAYRIAFCMFVALGILTLLSLQFVGAAFTRIPDRPGYDEPAKKEVAKGLAELGEYIRTAPITWGLLVPWLTLAAFFAVRSERARAIQADVLRASDPRPPVLLLRSFADDNLPFRRRLMPRRLFVANTFYRRGFTFEQLVAEEVSDIGPLISVGEPNEGLPPLGGARAYIQNLDWHEGVSRLIDEAGLIVLMVARTESFLWELRYVVEHGLLHKALLLFPPIKKRELVARCKVARAFLPPSVAEQLTTHLAESERTLLLVPAPDRVVLICGGQRNQWFYEAAFDIALDVLAGPTDARCTPPVEYPIQT